MKKIIFLLFLWSANVASFWSDPSLVFNALGNIQNPRIFECNGRWVAIWTQNKKIYGAYSKNGETWIPYSQPLSESECDQFDITSCNGKSIIVWSNNGTDIYIATSLDGILWTTSILYCGKISHIKIASCKEKYIIVWEEEEKSIYVSTSSDTKVWEKPTVLSKDGKEPLISCCDSSFFCLWKSSKGSNGAYLPKDDKTWQPLPIPISEEVIIDNLQVVGHQDTFLLVWQQTSNHLSSIYSAAINNERLEIQPLSETNATDPVLTSFGKNFVCAWLEEEGGRKNIHTATTTYNNLNWHHSIHNPINEDQMDVKDLKINSCGTNYLLTWKDQSNPSDIHSASSVNGLIWTLYPPFGKNSHQHDIYSLGGRFICLWEENGTYIYSSYFDIEITNLQVLPYKRAQILLQWGFSTKLTWDCIPGVTYKVYRNDKNDHFSQATFLKEVSKPEYIDYKLLRNTPYTYFVTYNYLQRESRPTSSYLILY